MSESVVFSVVELGEFPATRSIARDGRSALEALLADKTGIDLTIDFARVEAMTISFADEFLGKFLSSLDAIGQEITVKVSGLNTENAETVSVCLERRSAQVVILNSDGTLELDGTSPLPETFDAAAKLGSFKANDLAHLLGITAQNANNRLKRLAEVGAVRKARTAGTSRGGKEFMYTAVSPNIPDVDTLSTCP